MTSVFLAIKLVGLFLCWIFMTSGYKTAMQAKADHPGDVGQQWANWIGGVVASFLALWGFVALVQHL